MEPSTMFIAEMVITVGAAFGFGLWQLWDLRREKIKDEAKARAAAEAGAAGEPGV